MREADWLLHCKQATKRSAIIAEPIKTLPALPHCRVRAPRNGAALRLKIMSSDEQHKKEAAKVWCASLGEPSPEEQHDDALTSEYKGRSVRVDKVNGTVQNVKFGFAHVVLEDGTTANLKFEHLGKFLGHYTIWDSSTAEATASAALAVEAQAAEAAPLAPLTETDTLQVAASGASSAPAFRAGGEPASPPGRTETLMRCGCGSAATRAR